MWPAVQRMLSVLVGIGIACLVQLAVLPIWAHRQLTRRLADSLGRSVALLRGCVAAVKEQAQSGGGGGGGASGGRAGARAASVQRMQRKAAARLDALLKPTATVGGFC